jgi:4a-hydroxytetrahydrobiopterin dehydratase
MRDLYDDLEVEALLGEHPAWEMSEDGALVSHLAFPDFSRALLFVCAVGYLAESLNHHPDVRIFGYKHVELSVMSHDVDGITDRDRRLIEGVDRLRASSGQSR